MDNIVIIGYGGHSYVAIDIIIASGNQIAGYCDKAGKEKNPYSLVYFGEESSEKATSAILNSNYFVSVGDNQLRKDIGQELFKRTVKKPVSIIHPSAVVSDKSIIGPGTMIAPHVSINSLTAIGEGVICNTGCIIEHECNIGDYSHIAPGAVLAGNVTVGSCSFIGANSVIKEGITIGDKVIIGAGSVVLKNVESNTTVAGNPAKKLKNNS
jgi:sugar O-acyltransferase (sialic acid O-acetyltransferase NeuD family)